MKRMTKISEIYIDWLLDPIKGRTFKDETADNRDDSDSDNDNDKNLFSADDEESVAGEQEVALDVAKFGIVDFDDVGVKRKLFAR